jgi:hypothetical protein
MTLNDRFQQLVVLHIVAVVVTGSWLWDSGALGITIWWPLLCMMAIPLMAYAILQGAIQKRAGWWFLGCWSAIFFIQLAGFTHTQFITMVDESGKSTLERVKDVWNIPVWRPANYHNQAALRDGGILCGMLAMGALVVWTLNRRAIRLLLHILLLNGSVLALAGVVIKLSGQTNLLGVWAMPPGGFFAGFSHTGAWAGFAALTAGAGLGLFEYDIRRRHPEKPGNPWPILLVISLFLIGTIPFTAPRTGLVPTLFLGTWLAGWVLWKTGTKLFGANSREVPLAGQMALFVLSGLAAWATWKIPQGKGGDKSVAASPMTTQTEEGPGPGKRIRDAIWRDGMKMGSHRIYLGWGLGAFPKVFSEKFAGEEFRQKRLPMDPAYCELVKEEPGKLRFRPNFAAFPQSDDVPRQTEYTLEYSKPLQFPWVQEADAWRHRETEVTFTVYLGNVVMDERYIKVFLDEDAHLLRLSDPLVPNIIDWNFAMLKKREGKVMTDNAGWEFEIYDRNTTDVADFPDGKWQKAGDGFKSELARVNKGGARDALPGSYLQEGRFARIRVGKFDTNSIWADYLNGPYFRIKSKLAHLKDNEYYTFLCWAKRGEYMVDPENPPALGLEMGPEVQNKFQEFPLAVPTTQWRSYYVSSPYWDYQNGNFAIRRHSKSGKAAGAVLDIDNIEVFHHEAPGGIGISASGIGSRRVRLNFFYKGIYHPIEIGAEKAPEKDGADISTPCAYNDYLENWIEMGWVGVLLLAFPLGGLLVQSLLKGITSSIGRWMFPSIGAVSSLAMVDSPLQHPLVWWLFGVSIALAGKYSLLQGKEMRQKQRRK